MAKGASPYHFPSSELDLSSTAGRVRMNEDRLHFEYDRYYRLRNFQTIFFLFYTAIGAFLHKLFAFSYHQGIDHTVFLTLFILFLLSFLLFIGWTVNLVWPKAIVFIDLPAGFYKEQYDLYLREGEKGELEMKDPDREIPELLKENYLSQLEFGVEANKNKNDLVNVRNRQTLMWGMLALLLYLIAIVSMEVIKGESHSRDDEKIEKKQSHERKG